MHEQEAGGLGVGACGLLVAASLSAPTEGGAGEGTRGGAATRIGATGSNPLLIASQLPPINDRIAFELNGSNFRVVGAASVTDSRLAFVVYHAEGNLVGSFGRPVGDTAPPQ